jgi:hypothetical protein
MGMFLDDPPQPLHVPDLTKPAGAAVAADGTVACVMCGTRIALAQADVVGLGYRCAPCTRRSELHQLQMGVADNSANLHEGDRSALRAAARHYLGLGIAGVLGGLVLMAILPRGGLVVLTLGIGGLVIAATRWNASR